MNTLDFFLLQCNTQEEMVAAQSLEMNLRCLKGADGFEKELDMMAKNFPSRAKQFNSDWFKSLVEAIKPFYQPTEDMIDGSYENPFNEFLESVLCNLNNSTFALIGKIDPDLSNIAIDDLNKPHMQWVKRFTERFKQLRNDFPDNKRNWVRMSRIHPLNNINDEILLELSGVYFEDYFECMTFTEYVNWYVRSRDNFVIEGETLKPEVEQQLTSTLKVWLKDGVSTVDGCVESASRNYEFHSRHEGFLRGFVEKVKEGIAE